MKNNAHIDLNDRNNTNARFIQVNQLPKSESHLTAKLYVDNAIDGPSLVRKIQDNDFNNYNLTTINSITLSKQARNDNQVITKAYVDQFHNNNERTRRDLGLDFYDESSYLVKNNQDNVFNDNKLTNIDSITIIRNPTLGSEVSNKKYIHNSIQEGTLHRFNQTLQNYLKVSVGNDTYNLTKYDEIQITDLTEIRFPSLCNDLLQKWNINCNNKNKDSKVGNFIKSTITNNPSSHSGATSLPPIESAFMYIETKSNNHGYEKVFVSWERTDIIQISNITFYYNRFSILTNDSKKSMGGL